MYRGWRHDLEEKDLFDLNPRDNSRTLTAKFERAWRTEVQQFKRKHNDGYSGSGLIDLTESFSERTKLVKDRGNALSKGTFDSPHSVSGSKQNKGNPNLFKVLVFCSKSQASTYHFL